MMKTFRYVLLLSILLITTSIRAETVQNLPPAVPYDPKVPKVTLTDEQWKNLLTPAQYEVLRNSGTERAFTGKYDKFYEPGTYICAGCGQPLYSSKAKFDSGTGWPSFYEPLTPSSVGTREDRKFFVWVRTEVFCPRCDGHLGHVFDDGPKPTGLRYCMNSVALSFIPEKEGS